MLEKALLLLEKNNHLRRIKEEVDPYLEMAAIHLRVFEENGPALLFENIKGCKFRAVSNLFGNKERCKILFGKRIELIQKAAMLALDPASITKKPLSTLSLAVKSLSAIPRKRSSFRSFPFSETEVSSLPQITCWEEDGGAFITLPMVITEDPTSKSILKTNVGMYRIQLSGNEYEENKEVGLHYQIHRGIGVHQAEYLRQGRPMPVSVAVGGHPAHILSSVIPLPEGMSEFLFGGILAGKRVSYSRHKGYILSNGADFMICGKVYGSETKPEGPFGDHLGYYSLKHPFPVMKVEAVFHKKNAIWPLTVVGRPPQEDTFFGSLIHEMTASVLPKKIAGLHSLNAVDESGVHPLLLAVGSERYTPYLEKKRPQELLTIANHILGLGQLSLAKYLFIVDKEDNPALSPNNCKEFFIHLLERIDFRRDIHFHTNTVMDTLDYTGGEINTGSKVVFAAVGKKERTLSTAESVELRLPKKFSSPKKIFDGVLAIQSQPFSVVENEKKNIEELKKALKSVPEMKGFPLVILTDDSRFTAETMANFLWVTFTKSDPARDIYGVEEFVQDKHWGCLGSLIIDARQKPYMPKPLEKNQMIEKKINRFWEKGGSLAK